MKKGINSNMKIVLTFILFVTLLILFLVFETKAETKGNVNVTQVNSNVNINTETGKNFNSYSGPAILPSELSKNPIKTMAIGEQGFNIPSAMIVNEDGKCYLLGNISNESDKKYQIKYGWIQIVKQKDGYYVNVVKGEDTFWTRQPIPYLRDRVESRDLIPVKRIQIVVR